MAEQVLAQTPRAQYTASASQTVFSYPFQITSSADIDVYRIRSNVVTAFVLTTDYTLTDVGNINGGTVVLVTGATVGDIIVVVRNTDIQRLTGYTSAGAITGDNLNDDFNQFLRIAQELKNAIDRSVHMEDSDPGAVTGLDLPPKATRANRFAAFDADGAIIAAAGTSADLAPVSAFIDTLLDDTDAATARSTLGAAPRDPQHMVLATHADLTNERVFTPNAGLGAVDGGAGGAYTLYHDPGFWMRGRLNGLTLANNSGDAANDIDIAAGVCASSTSPTRFMALNATITKRLDAGWAGGTAAGGLDTGAEANSTWYHLHLIGLHDRVVTNRARATNVATLTSTAHGLAVGQTVWVRGVGASYDGLATVASVPGANTFTYANTGSDEGSTASGGLIDGFDALFSASATAPTMPSGWTSRRRLGSVRNDGSGNILAFIQRADHFWLSVPISDLNANTMGTAAVLRTLTVPSGVKVVPLAAYHLSDEDAGATSYLLITGPDQADTTPSITVASAGSFSSVGGAYSDVSSAPVLTNTSSQVRSRVSSSGANTHLRITTHGWVDDRGKND